MKNRRRWIILGIVVVLVAVGVVLITNNQRSAAQAAAQANVQMGRVTRATLLSTVDSSGSVTPESKVTLSFGASGTVAKVNVKVGDHVKKGDVLAELDASSLQLQLAQQQQSYLSQQASYSMTIQPIRTPSSRRRSRLTMRRPLTAWRSKNMSPMGPIKS